MKRNKPWGVLALDYDGPCVASAQIYYRSVCHLFRRAKKPVPSFAYFRDAISVGVDQFHKNSGITEHFTLEDAGKIREIYVERHWDEIHLTPGTRTLLRTCACLAVPVIIISSNKRTVIERKLNEHHLHRFVREIFISGNKKEALEKAAKRFRVPFHKILFVEDSSEPIIAANELGVTTVAFLGGFNSQTKLLAANPSFIAQHMHDVTGLIAQ